MEVNVDRQKMIVEIEKDLAEYEVEYQSTIEIYKSKLAEYSIYVTKQVEDSTTKTIRSPPYPPTSKKEEFEESLEMLKAHVGETIKMEDHEFKGLKSGIKDLHVSNTIATTSLSALSY